MDEHYKRSIKQSHLRQTKKTRSREEQRLLQETSKQRKKNRPPKPVRKRDFDENDEEDWQNVERMRSSSQADLEQTLREARRQHLEEKVDALELTSGTVVSVQRSQFRVRTAEGAEFEVEFARAVGQPAVGDEVRFSSDQDRRGRLRLISPRRSVISRPDPHNPKRERVLAANVDLAVIVAAVRQPDFRAGLIDRFLITIERGQASPLVCANKVDLLEGTAERQVLERQLDVVRELGVPVLWTSASTGEGVRDLRAALEGKTCVFVGHSGVGKSALLNALDPGGDRGTGSGREFDGKGRHTTTSSQLVDLPHDTRLIDTPGIRTLGLWKVSRAELADFFPEFLEHARGCKFRDCSHVQEPDCGVQSALEEGRLSRARYETYLRLASSLEE